MSPLYYVGARGLDSGLDACVTSTALSEPFPAPFLVAF